MYIRFIPLSPGFTPRQSFGYIVIYIYIDITTVILTAYEYAARELKKVLQGGTPGATS